MDSVRMSVAVFPRDNCPTTVQFNHYPSEQSQGWLIIQVGCSDVVFHSMKLEGCRKLADEIYNAIRIAEEKQTPEECDRVELPASSRP